MAEWSLRNPTAVDVSVKVKNPTHSQMVGRWELFEARKINGSDRAGAGGRRSFGWRFRIAWDLPRPAIPCAPGDYGSAAIQPVLSRSCRKLSATYRAPFSSTSASRKQRLVPFVHEHIEAGAGLRLIAQLAPLHAIALSQAPHLLAWLGLPRCPRASIRA